MSQMPALSLAAVPGRRKATLELAQQIEQPQADAAQIFAQILLGWERLPGDGFPAKIHAQNMRPISSTNGHSDSLI